MGLLIFFYWFVWFRMWSFKSSLYILDTSSLSDIFSQALACHVKPVLASLKEHTFIICIKSNFSSALMGHAFGVVSQISSPKPKGHWIFPQYFYLDISQFSIYIWVYDPFGVNFCERIKLCIYICFFFFFARGCPVVWPHLMKRLSFVLKEPRLLPQSSVESIGVNLFPGSVCCFLTHTPLWVPCFPS